MTTGKTRTPMAQLAIRVGALVGVAVTAYALYVEHRMAAAKKDGEEYEALCDIRHGDVTVASCSAVFGSSYARILSHWGLVPHGGALGMGLMMLAFAGPGTLMLRWLRRQ